MTPVILDSNFILDLVAGRGDAVTRAHNAKIIALLLREGMACVPSASLGSLQYITAKHYPACSGNLELLLQKVRLVASPSSIDQTSPLAQQDIEDYIVEQAAHALDGMVLTSDQQFLTLSRRALSPDSFFEFWAKQATTVRFLDLRKQYLSINDEIDAAVARTIATTSFIGGGQVQRFEEEFAAYEGAGFCVGVGNGTDALEIALEALDLPPGSEVIVPANSFIATSEAVTRAGLRVVFCDCDPVNYTLSLSDAERRITPATRAIIPVHLYGRACPMDAVMALADHFDLRVVEDCAQAHGAEWGGRRVGTFGAAGAFSFYPGKNLGAYGDAGAILTNDETTARKCRMIANHGRIGKYDHEFEGRNSRMDGIQAAVLSVKLRHLDTWLDRRRAVAEKYRASLCSCQGIELPASEAVDMRHVYHLFVVRSQERNRLQAHLKEYGVETGIHYPIALTKLPAYAYCGQAMENLDANRLDGEILSLPMGEHLTDRDVSFVIDAVKNFVA